MKLFSIFSPHSGQRHRPYPNIPNPNPDSNNTSCFFILYYHLYVSPAAASTFSSHTAISLTTFISPLFSSLSGQRHRPYSDPNITTSVRTFFHSQRAAASTSYLNPRRSAGSGSGFWAGSYWRWDGRLGWRGRGGAMRWVCGVIRSDDAKRWYKAMIWIDVRGDIRGDIREWHREGMRDESKGYILYTPRMRDTEEIEWERWTMDPWCLLPAPSCSFPATPIPYPRGMPSQSHILSLSPFLFPPLPPP